MNLIYYKNLGIVLLIMVGIFLVSAVLFISLANAAEGAQIQAAIKELSSVTGQDVTSEDQAKELCNQEQYLDVCADIGKKHDLYTSEEIKSVDGFLNEVKGKILDDIKNCDNEECLVRVASELALKIKTKNPTLATDLSLTTKIVAEKQSVVQAAKEAGVNFKDCESMNPDTASVDLLRRCARLAKDTRVQKYIPEERRVSADQFGETTIQLREGLSTGKYQCGDNTLEGCGNFCLNPDTATRAVGIPAVCTQIAKDVFGQEGVKQLESSYQQVGQVKDYYSKKFILTLPDGKELVGEGQIRNICDQAFSSRNLETAKACGNFAVKNGFASQSDVERGLKLMESFTQKGQNVDFEKCLNDPRSCRDFIPEGERGQFDAGNQIFEIMKTEIGFDPSQCERGSIDQTIGTKCFEGSKRALVKIESLGLVGKSKEAGFIVEDIKRHLADGERMMSQKDQFKEVFNQKGGPGSCRSEAECFTYCSNPTNGPECIAFGSQQNISGFSGEEAIQKFQEYNQNVQKSSDVTSNEYRPYSADGGYIQFPGQGPYPGFQPPGQGVSYPPGQVPGFTQPGPVGPSPECFAAIQLGDFTKAKTVCSSPNSSIPLPSTQICPASPYVECPVGQFRESFRNDKGCWVDGVCKSVPTFTPSGDPTVECQKRGGVWDSNVKDCRFPDPIYSPYPTYSPGPGGWINKTWKFKDGSTQSSSILGKTDSEYSNYISGVYNNCSTRYFTGWKSGAGDQSNWQEFGIPVCSDTVSTTVSPYPTYSPGPSPIYSPYPTATGGTGDMYSCFYPNATKNGTAPGYTVWCEKDYFNCHEGGKTGPSVSLDGLALGMPSSCESGYQGKSCNNNKFCDSNETYASCPSDCGGTTYSPYPSPSIGSCPSGYHSHGDSGGYCMNDQENYGGTCYNSAGTSKITCPIQPTYSPYPSSSSTPTSSGTCPSGAHIMYVNNAGGYCMSDNDGTKCGPMNSSSVSSFGSCSGYQTTATYSPGPGESYTPYPTCPSGQYWDYSSNSCKSNTSYGGCTGTTQSSCTSVSNCYWDSANNYCFYQSYSGTPYPTTTSTYTPPPSCSSDQYWDGSSCVTNPTPYPTTEYTPPPSTYSPPPVESYSPPPTYSESPAPTSSLYNGYMVAHCQELGRTWNGKICQANGLFARFYEGSGLANALRLFYMVP